MRKNKDPRLQKISDFYCTECGHKNYPIIRTTKEREPGHLKKLYCLYCRKETNMAEIRQGRNTYTLEDFEIEYKNGNFLNGERKIPYKQFIANLRKEKRI